MNSSPAAALPLVCDTQTSSIKETMKRYTKLLILFLTLSSLRSNACLNYYVVDSSGHRNMHDDYPPSNIFIHAKYDIEDLKTTESKIFSAPTSEKYKYISNYCASMIQLGRYREAIPILENLLKDKPNEYEINTNLAVAYELNEQIDKALYFLKKSISISPKSHNESEWFHLRILESAITLRDKNLAPQDISVLRIENERSGKTGVQISYQLKERIPLTKSTNNLLSKVIEESADYYKANISLEWAIELYAIAIGYSSNDSIKLKLWDKINLSRQKLIDFKNEGKEGSVSKYLFRSNWKKKINQRINEWTNYIPYYYDKEIKTTF
jgi:tetratricopeptide (TPR) repeat protein